MKPIKAKVSELLTILKKNRELHEEIFVAAQKIYRSEVIRKLDQALQSAKDGKDFPSYISIPAPENHSKDYDRVIRMLELSVDDTVELAENEVEVYVMDKWSWSHNWAASNMAYLNDAAVSNFTGSALNHSSLFGGCAATGAVSASWSNESVKTYQGKLSQYL